MLKKLSSYNHFLALKAEIFVLKQYHKSLNTSIFVGLKINVGISAVKLQHFFTAPLQHFFTAQITALFVP
jgi:hypothetical protein